MITWFALVAFSLCKGETVIFVSSLLLHPVFESTLPKQLCLWLPLICYAWIIQPFAAWLCISYDYVPANTNHRAKHQPAEDTPSALKKLRQRR